MGRKANAAGAAAAQPLAPSAASRPADEDAPVDSVKGFFMSLLFGAQARLNVWI